jgi:hypothetical protein
MTKKLEELFDLEETVKQHEISLGDVDIYQKPAPTDSTDKVDSALPRVDNLGLIDDDLDKIANIALKAHNEIYEYAQNVEPRHAAELYEKSATMLKIAQDSIGQKMTRRLKTIELQLKKQQLTQNAAMKKASVVEGKPEINANNDEGEFLDRNSFLLNQKK